VPGVIADGSSVVWLIPRLGSFSGRLFLNSRLFRPFTTLQWLRPARESVVNIGATGPARPGSGQGLAEDATVEVMNNVVEVVAESDEVRDLVQSQTISLLQEFLASSRRWLRGRHGHPAVTKLILVIRRTEYEILIDLPVVEQDLAVPRTTKEGCYERSTD
jgi:hypothetical protein